MTTTAYLDLFLRSVTEPALLQTFLSFILLHQHESVHILDTLVSRINTPFQVETEGSEHASHVVCKHDTFCIFEYFLPPLPPKIVAELSGVLLPFLCVYSSDSCCCCIRHTRNSVKNTLAFYIFKVEPNDTLQFTCKSNLCHRDSHSHSSLRSV